MGMGNHRFHVHADGNIINVHDHLTDEKLRLTPDGEANTPYRAVQAAVKWINDRAGLSLPEAPKALALHEE